MGNQTSISSCFTLSGSSSTAKLYDSQGNLRRLKLPVKAAELMLEHPGHAVSSAEELRSKRRVVALRADDELVAGKLYLMVPLSRINCKVSDSEMAFVSDSKKKSIRKGSKVSPAATNAGEEEENSSSPSTSIVKINGHRQQWSPALETIMEWSREFSFTS